MFERFTSDRPDREYWLRRCEGVRVETPSGRLGIVESLRFGRLHDRPDELVVRTGLLRSRLVAVDVDDVEAVLPREQRIVLRRDLDRGR
jgi:hypothetical protein